MKPIRDLNIYVAVIAQQKILIVWHNISVVKGEVLFAECAPIVSKLVIGIHIINQGSFVTERFWKAFRALIVFPTGA
jgi:hypothetical protein